MEARSLNAKVWSSGVVRAGGRQDTKSGGRFALGVGLICVVGVLLWLGMLYVRRMVGRRHTRIFMVRGLS